MFLGMVGFVLIFLELGYRGGVVVHRRSAEEKESPVSVISGAILGLAAFMLAFSFGIVSNRFDSKKELVREDANVIRTAWRRADFLPEPDRAESIRLLRGYVDARLAFSQRGDDDPQVIRAGLDGARRVHDRLWAIAVVNARKDMNSDVAALYIESLNDMANVHALRVAVGLQARVPLEIWLSLLFLTALGMSAVGYHTAIADSKRSMIQPILAICFAMVIACYASLDRPNSGVLRVRSSPGGAAGRDGRTSARSAEDHLAGLERRGRGGVLVDDLPRAVAPPEDDRQAVVQGAQLLPSAESPL
jgi:hypothetical protein